MGLIDFDHLDPSSQQMARQASPIRGGRFHTDAIDAAKLLQPAQQLAIAVAGGGKRLVAQTMTVVVESYRVMGLLVAIHATDDTRLQIGHTPVVVSSVRGDPVAGGWTQQ